MVITLWGRNAFSSSCCIWSLLSVLCWLMASSQPVGASCGPWALMQSLGSINLVLPLVLFSKVFQFPFIRIVSARHLFSSLGFIYMPWQYREPSRRWASDLLTLYTPIQNNKILRLKVIFSILKSRCYLLSL